MASYNSYERAEFFEPIYHNPISVTPYDFYPPPAAVQAPLTEPILSGEPVIPYGWRPDWSRPTEWEPPPQLLHTLPPEHRAYGYMDMANHIEMKPLILKPIAREMPANKPFRCQLCGKSFSQAANLTAHKRVHTGERPFTCPLCSRRFSQSSSLVTHRRTHTNERPYQCSHCDKKFTDSSTLTKHLRTHTVHLCFATRAIQSLADNAPPLIVGPFEVKDLLIFLFYDQMEVGCLYTDSKEAARMYDREESQGQKPYGCDICFMRFTQSGNLHRHMKTHKNL